VRVVVCDTGPVLHLREAEALQLLAATGEVFIRPLWIGNWKRAFPTGQSSGQVGCRLSACLTRMHDERKTLWQSVAGRRLLTASGVVKAGRRRISISCEGTPCAPGEPAGV